MSWHHIILSFSSSVLQPAICVITSEFLFLTFIEHDKDQSRRISGKGVYWGKGESHEFSKKAWKPVVPIGLLLLLPKKSLGWVKNITFWVIQKNMNFDRKWVENVWYSRAFISSTKVLVLHHFGKLRQNAIRFRQEMGQKKSQKITESLSKKGKIFF